MGARAEVRGKAKGKARARVRVNMVVVVMTQRLSRKGTLCGEIGNGGEGEVEAEKIEGA